MSDRVSQLKELIAGVDPSDPFGLMDRGRWQAELKRLLGRNNPEVEFALGRRAPRTKSEQPLPRGDGGYRQSIRAMAKKQRQGLSRKEIEVQLLKRPPRPEKQLNPGLPLPQPNPGSLAWCKRQWQPALQACRKQVRILEEKAVHTAKRPKSHPNHFERGLHNNLIGLINVLLNTTDGSGFSQAQAQILKYRKAHPPLRAIPVPEPLPTPPAKQGTKQGSKAKKRPTKGEVSVGISPRRDRRSDGESFAAYNRLPALGGGRSFEESVALRQGSRQDRRALIDRIDRVSASGGREEYEDLD